MSFLGNIRGRMQQHQAAAEQRQTAHKEQLALEQQRAANGHCPKCDSENLQAVSNTTSKQTLGSGSNIADLAHGTKYNPTHMKIQTTIVRVCLNCGYQFH